MPISILKAILTSSARGQPLRRPWNQSAKQHPGNKEKLNRIGWLAGPVQFNWYKQL